MFLAILVDVTEEEERCEVRSWKRGNPWEVKNEIP